MAQDYIVISAFNEGHIARRFSDQKFQLVKGNEVSQTFNTIKGLSDTWKKDQIKWSSLDGEPVPERKQALRGTEITKESPAVLPASKVTSNEEADSRASDKRSFRTDSPKQGTSQLGDAPTQEAEATAPEVAEGGDPAPIADNTTKPVRPRNTAKK